MKTITVLRSQNIPPEFDDINDPKNWVKASSLSDSLNIYLCEKFRFAGQQCITQVTSIFIVNFNNVTRISNDFTTLGSTIKEKADLEYELYKPTKISINDLKIVVKI